MKLAALNKDLIIAAQQEAKLSLQLTQLTDIIADLESKSTDKFQVYGITLFHECLSFQALLQQDRLLSRIDAMETQLGFYVSKRKREHRNSDQDSEAAQLIQAQAERHQYEMTAKVGQS